MVCILRTLRKNKRIFYILRAKINIIWLKIIFYYAERSVMLKTLRELIVLGHFLFIIQPRLNERENGRISS